MENRPRIIKDNPEISFKNIHPDLQPYFTIGMEYTLQTYGDDSSKPTWTMDKYLINLSTDLEPITKGTTIKIVE